MGPIGRVAIVGRGLIGGSIELALRERHRAADLVVLDRGDDLADLHGASVVVLSAPVAENIRILPRLRAHVSSDTLVTDTGSTKVATVAAAAGMRFVGGHPIAGAAESGREAARGDLFAGRPWILTPSPDAAPEDLDRVRAFVASLGATVHVLSPEDHDRLFALVSHLPQLVASALMDVVGRTVGGDGLALAGAGLRDSTRLASSPPDIWRDILQTNQANIRLALDAMIEVLARLRDDPDGEAVDELFESAARWKQALGK